jgi:hypothetical protein
LLAFYADREGSWWQAWKLACAALLPGALLLSLAILGYTCQHLHLVQLLLAFLFHLVMGWVYGLFAPFCLPRARAVSSTRNPFEQKKRKPQNPFADGAE